MDDFFDRLGGQLGTLVENGAHRRRSVRLLARRAGGVAVLASSAAIVIAIAAIALSAGKGRPPAGSLSHRAIATDIAPGLVRSFRVLRRALRASDRLPGSLAGIGANGGPLRLSPSWQPNSASLGLVPALARRAILGRTGFSAWVIPGRHGLCWDARDPTGQLIGGLCSRFPFAASALTDEGGIAYDRGVTVGLVTDRVVSLELVTGPERPQSVPLSSGFYAAHYQPGSQLVAVTIDGRHVPLPIVDLPGAIGRAMPVPGTIVGQARLEAPNGGSGPQGTAWVDDTGGRHKVWVTATGMRPNTPGNAYALWLAGGPSESQMLGFAGTVGRNGQLAIASTLPATRYRARLLITIQKTGFPAHPRNIVLQGPLNR